MSILKEIYNYKVDFVFKQKKILSQSSIENKLSLVSRKNNSFYNKLLNENNSISIIGEIKKASPSLGEFINDTTDISKIAKIYEQNNITCLSILTDEKYFRGSINDLINIKKNTSIPILRKDFIVDEYQIYESKLYGADCILIILSMLNYEEADKFTQIANDLQIDTIIEVHDRDEFEKACKMSSNMIGINNRNLNNFVTNLQTTIELGKNSQNCDKLLISESGFKSKKDIQKIYETTGISNFLIGEYLMKSEDLALNIKELIN